MEEFGIWEEWKPVKIDIECTNKSTIEVSNFGRVRSFNQISKGRILKGSITEGYKVIRMKLFKPRDSQTIKYFQELKSNISELYKQRRKLFSKKALDSEIRKINIEIEKKEADLSRKFAKDLKKRTINHHFLVHRMVAELFLEKPSPKHTIVGHLDHDKLNNRVSNLKWMTQSENATHQGQSPKVLAEKKLRKAGLSKRLKGQKLDSTQVLHIKQQLKRDRNVKQIAKQFKVSEMQIYRIKNGENWSHVTLPE